MTDTSGKFDAASPLPSKVIPFLGIETHAQLAELNRRTGSRHEAPAWRSNDKQILFDNKHFADAVSVAAAQHIVCALNSTNRDRILTWEDFK